MAFDADLTDEEYGSMTQLQWLAHFYREPTGPGSLGGYEALFHGESAPCPFLNQERKEEAWKINYDYVKSLPKNISDYIAGDLSIEELGSVEDAGDFSQLIKDVPIIFKRKWSAPVVI